MENQAIRVIIKEPYKKAVISEIKDNLKSLQEIVGGYIEDVPFPTVDGVDLIINEDGKIRKLAGNFFLPHYQDCVVGTCIIASYNDDDQFASLSDEQIKKVNKYINTFEIKDDYDLYEDFELLNSIMNKKMKEFDGELV